MKLVLHIGTEKTGTTLLQNWLYANQQALSDQGVFLSDQLGKPNNRKIVAYFQRKLDDFMRREKVFSREEKAIYFAGFEAAMLEEIDRARADHHTMVITSEHFHSRLGGPGEIAELGVFLKSHFSEIRVLCYFREQSSMRESLYSTALKSSEERSFELFHADAGPQNYYFNFLQIATQWSAVFGREYMDCRIYDRARFKDGDIRKDFLSALFEPVDVAQIGFETEIANESLSLLQGRMLQAINRNIPFWGERGGLNPANAALKALVERCKRLSHGRIRDPQGAQFAARFKDSNQTFFERFLPGQEGFPVAENCRADPERLPLDMVADMVEEIADVFSKGLGQRQLLDRDAVVLREVALKYESGEALTREEALALMQMAQRVRPWGPVIREKIRTWSMLD